MPTYTYERVERWVEKTVSCRVCGKKLKRSTTLGQTINPFNKDAEGNVKNRYQIQAELKVAAEAWQPTNDIHAKCREIEAAPTESAAS
jgi:hypothetical protein